MFAIHGLTMCHFLSFFMYNVCFASPVTIFTQYRAVCLWSSKLRCIYGSCEFTSSDFIKYGMPIIFSSQHLIHDGFIFYCLATSFRRAAAHTVETTLNWLWKSHNTAQWWSSSGPFITAFHPLPPSTGTTISSHHHVERYPRNDLWRVLLLYTNKRVRAAGLGFGFGDGAHCISAVSSRRPGPPCRHVSLCPVFWLLDCIAPVHLLLVVGKRYIIIFNFSVRNIFGMHRIARNALSSHCMRKSAGHCLTFWLDGRIILTIHEAFRCCIYRIQYTVQR